MRPRLRIPLLLALLLLCMLVASGVGALPLRLTELWALLLQPFGIDTGTIVSTAQHHVFWQLRLARVLLGAFVGAVLAVAGVLLQGLCLGFVARR